MRLNSDELGRLFVSAEQSMFPEFWRALLQAVYVSRLAPARLLAERAPSRLPKGARQLTEALRSAECPFDLHGSKWGSQTMLGAFRRLAARAGIPGAEELGFDCLYA